MTLALVIVGALVIGLLVLAAFGAPGGGSWTDWCARRRATAFDYGKGDPRR